MILILVSEFRAVVDWHVINWWNHVVCMVNGTPPYCLGKWCIFIMIRERPFNLKGGGVWVFSKKYSDFGREKKNNLIQCLSYNQMLNSGEKKSRFARQKKINILTLVLSEKKILNNLKVTIVFFTRKLTCWISTFVIITGFFMYIPRVYRMT